MEGTAAGRRESIAQAYLNKRMATLLGLGFASGLPAPLMADTLDAWLTKEGVSAGDIGLFSLVGLPLGFKFLWAPLMDSYAPRLGALGPRRSWLLLTQLAVLGVIAGLAATGVHNAPAALWCAAGLALCLAFCSASQDIVGDAYRTDLLPPAELGAGAAVWVTGYRVAMIVSAGLALSLAARVGYRGAYLIMAGFMLVGIAATLLAPEPPAVAGRPATLRQAVVDPLRQFMQRFGARLPVIALFIVLFKLPDVMAAKMTSTFLLRHLAFTPDEVGWVRQSLGLLVTILGALVGGGIVARLGLWRSLWIFGGLQAASNFGFYLLASHAGQMAWLVGVVCVENFCAGLVTAGFVGFLMSLCDRRYSAFQFALLSSLLAMTRALGGTPSGYLVDGLGGRYDWFFLGTIAAGLPGLALLPFLRRCLVPAQAGTGHGAEPPRA